MLLNYKRIIIPVFIFLVVWGEKNPYKISETKAIIFAQLSFARDNLRLGSYLRCLSQATCLLQVTQP